MCIECECGLGKIKCCFRKERYLKDNRGGELQFSSCSNDRMKNIRNNT